MCHALHFTGNIGSGDISCTAYLAIPLQIHVENLGNMRGLDCNGTWVTWASNSELLRETALKESLLPQPGCSNVHVCRFDFLVVRWAAVSN